ncbi:MAG: DUF1987 domain-containing protein [Flavobacteriales bacterium]|nr:DUF1987 domain-containing protein [Flavobacteriales bacterium]
MMENLSIEKTIKTPKIFFDYQKGELLIEGISIPENTVDFYKDVLKWVESYQENPKPKTELVLKLEYFNTSTSVVLLNIFKLFSQIQNSDLKIVWFYEEDDVEMEEVGEDYQNIVKIPFELVSIESF